LRCFFFLPQQRFLLRPMLQHGWLFSQQRTIEMPSVFATAQQELQEKEDAKSAMRPR
jgi:hypothetical protein